MGEGCVFCGDALYVFFIAPLCLIVMRCCRFVCFCLFFLVFCAIFDVKEGVDVIYCVSLQS